MISIHRLPNNKDMTGCIYVSLKCIFFPFIMVLSIPQGKKTGFIQRVDNRSSFPFKWLNSVQLNYSQISL